MTSWPTFSAECRKEIDQVLRSGKLTAYRANKLTGVGPTEGSQAYELEREIERKFKVRHAVVVNSGTAALHAGLAALDVRGKEVITSPYTFSATASAIILAGGIPRFADVDSHTFCITKETVSRAITKKTAAILPVHLFGYFQDLEGLRGFGLPVVEDACQAVGAVRNGTYAGTAGAAGAFSFNGSKNIPAGEGGCLVTNDDRIAEKARAFINHQENFDAEDVSPNYRMHELVAVLARHGLAELNWRNNKRRALASIVSQALKKLSAVDAIPEIDPSHVFYVYGFTLQSAIDRDSFIRACFKQGLHVGAGYIQPHLGHYPAFRKYVTRELPVVDELSSRRLCMLYGLTPNASLAYAKGVALTLRRALE